MTYDLYIGDRTFSSWSLRGWLMLEKFNLPHRTHLMGLYAGSMAQEMAHLAPARLVPSIQTDDGTIISESLAIAETLHENHPEAGLWPQDPKSRATARWLCAAMAAGFGDLRGECPMQLQYVLKGFQVSDAVLKDLDHIEALWSHARAVRQSDGDWLFGEYSVADVFYAPVAARIVGYDLPVSQAARSYCKTMLKDPAFKTWRTEGLKVTYDPFPYGAGLEKAPWPTD